MSFRGNRDHFNDILSAIANIQVFVAGVAYADYLVDRKTEAAVERELQIVSETAYRLAGDAEILCPGIPWHEVRATGNVLRHGYHAIHNELIWNTIHDDLLTLKVEVEAALARLND